MVAASQLVGEVTIQGAEKSEEALRMVGTASTTLQKNFSSFKPFDMNRAITDVDAARAKLTIIESDVQVAREKLQSLQNAADAGKAVTGIPEAEAKLVLLQEKAQMARTDLAELESQGNETGDGMRGKLAPALGEVGNQAENAGEKLRGGFLSSVRESMSAVGGGFLSSLRSGVSGLLDFGAKIGQTAFGIQSFIQTIGSVANAMISPNASMEQTQVAFEHLLGGAKAAGKELSELQKIAADTPFEFPDLARAEQKFIAFQIPLKETHPLLLAIGDALSSLGENTPATLDQVVQVFGQMNAAGKIQTQDLLQLTSVGINGFQLLADQMHKPVSVIKQMVTDGLIPADKGIEMLRKGMADTFGGGMAAQAGTWNGLMSTLSDTIGTMWRSFSGPTFKLAEGALKRIGDLLSSQSFTDFATGLGQQLANIFQTIGQWIEDAEPPARRFAAGLDAVGKIISTNLSPAFDTLKGILQPFGDLFSHVSDLFPQANTGIKQLDDTMGPLAPIFKTIMDASKGFGDTIASLGKDPGVLGFIASLKDGFQQVGQIIGGQVGQDFQQFMQTAQQVGNWFQTDMLPAIQQAMPGFEHLGSVLATDVAPALAQIWAIGQQFTSQVLPPLIQGFETIAPIAVQVGGFLANQLGNALQFLAPFAVQAAQALSNFGTSILTTVLPYVQQMWGLIQGFLDWIKPYWPAIWNGLVTGLTSAWDTIKGTVQIAWAIVSGIIKIGLDVMTGNWKKVWEDVKSMFSGIWDGIKSIAQGAWNLVQKPIMDGIHSFQKTWNDVWNGTKKTFSDIWNSLSGIASGAWNNVAGAVRGGINAVIDAIDNFISGVNNIHVTLPGGVSLGFSIPLIPHLATGGLIGKAGMALVGERGPEQVFLPAGAQVIPHGQAFGGGTPPQQNIQIDVYLDGNRVSASLMPHIANQIRWAVGA